MKRDGVVHRYLLWVILNSIKSGLAVSMLATLLFTCITSGAVAQTTGEAATAQQKNWSVSGKVTDSAGLPLPGVTIVQKGTTNGIVTDFDGNYSFSGIYSDAVLVFSFVGMQTEEISVNGRKELNLKMEAQNVAIEEVVAIGYGTMRKKDLTGAVATVNGDLVAKRQATQLSQALQGSMPGVTITRSNSEPGASATIRVRGITTISDSNPLIIVDGVPVSNINDINPNDIQDISVLKDAASASIYGARAASGVVLITTRRAKKGQINMEYSASFGIEKPTEFPEVVDAVRYMEMSNEQTWNDAGNKEGGEYGVYSKDEIENWMEWNKTNPNEYPVTDWVGLLLNDYAPRQTHNLSLSHGGEKVKTNASINYEYSEALYDYNSYERISTRVNNTININDYLSGTIDFSFNSSLSENPVGNPVYDALRYAPIYAAVWSDGRVAEGKSSSNEYAALNYGGYNNLRNNKLFGKIALDFKPVKNLTITGVVAPTLHFAKNKKFVKQIPYYDADDPTTFLGYIAGHENTSLKEERNDKKTMTKQLLVKYLNSFNDAHNVNLMAGYEDFELFNESLSAFRDKYLLSNFPYLDLGPLDYQENSGSALESAYRSYFGRVIYDYKSKYFAQANIRYDGSSRFHPDYRWAAFPSFSAGWAISEEDFMKDVSALSFLKLRASWGTLGNERIGNYPYQASIGFSNALFYQNGSIVSSTTAAQYQYAIPDITWETTETWDVGIDANFFDNRLLFSGDYYVKKTKDMLLELEVPDFMGYENPDQNTGTMDTKGWEIQLSWRDKVGELNYAASFNVSDYISKMGDLGGIVFDGSIIKREGSEYNEWYGYLSDGLFQTQKEIDDSPLLYSSVKPGDVKYIDISGPDGVPDGQITPDYDRVLLGGSLPRFVYGGNISADYKGFDLSVVVQGVGKQNSRVVPQMVKPFYSGWTNAPKIIDGNYWSLYNTEEQNLNAKYPRLSYVGAENNNYEMSDFWLINGAYFRLKNITLGYTLPKQVVQRVRLNGVRLFASASDLFSFNHYPKGWDPEVSYNSYISKSFNVGLSVKF
ncbi:TonB-linked outer membrane protein, SusC/RagA family [Mariniphaga anaerophila]|uniref:TonB-linked outer membrane protein, SusC/RagA family n=1 Tax=Mariniphaga anaerophila TaxID=1484053 RepID=A0A1M5DXV0_9BACT|nr:TonB-dependent receptor [Mariniphaga anaerophila]SHF71704.1 TonB-linked outer membrane protein, SusC/RagA family [Mariniphaga anaerophila]